MQGSIIPLYIIPYIFIFIALYFIGLIDKESKITFTSVRADVSLEPSKLIAELKRSSTRWVI
jgi:hypothetical protein